MKLRKIRTQNAEVVNARVENARPKINGLKNAGST